MTGASEPTNRPDEAAGGVARTRANVGWLKVRAKMTEGRNALRQYTFLVYFLVIVVLVGALGVWIPLVGSALGVIEAGWREVVHEVGTCVMAIVCSGAADLILTDKEHKAVKATAISLIILCFFTLVGTFLPRKGAAVTCAVLGGGFALLAWVLANADNIKLSDESDAMGALGGKTDHLSGKTTDIKV